jgi:MFS transporter, DHA3 family, tetracycline resistance protein
MDPKKLYILQIGLINLAMTMMMTAAIVYRIDVAKLEPYELILLGTALEISVILFEVPTGILADIYSRKLSVIIGYIVIGIGFLIETSSLSFLWIFVAQITWGFGYTFISGALDAWVSDETRNEGIELTLVKASSLGKVFSMLAIVFALVLGLIDIRLPMLMSVLVLFLFGITLIFVMKETVPLAKRTEESPRFFSQFTKGLRHIFSHPILKIFALTAFLFGLFSEGIDRLEEFIVLDRLKLSLLGELPSIYIVSGMHMIAQILGLIMLLVIGKTVKNSVYRWFIVLVLSMSFGLFLFAGVGHPLIAIAGFFFFRMTREGTRPLYVSILAREVPDSIKATVMSTYGQIDSIGQIGSGILMTTVVLLVSTRASLVVSASILLVAAYTLWLMLRTKRRMEKI